MPPVESVLIVDDTPANLRLLAQMLAESGYAIHAAKDGSQAMTLVQHTLPDLILLDIMMPGMSGYDVCQRLKEDERTRAVPVIFLSALGDLKDKTRAFAAGGVDYITKPFQAEEVLARVRTHLHIKWLQGTLLRKIAELEAANQELDAYAHTVAHDLSDPLSTVYGYARLLSGDAAEMSPDDVRDCLTTLAAMSQKAINVTRELLLFASVRKEEVGWQVLDMGQVVGGALARLPALPAEIIQPTSWPQALGYAPWVEEVWVNYISNAIKYGGNPPVVELGWNWIKDEGGRMKAEDGTSAEEKDISSSFIPHPSAFLCFWVRDNGPGVPPEKRDHLFAEFSRLDQVRIKGHGLGLSIVQRIVSKLGGQVGVESELGRGSLFYFVLQASVAGK